MRKQIVFVWFLILGAVTRTLAQAGDWRPGFIDPPDSVRPSVYWYWLDDNISQQGVREDIAAMARLGIGRAFIGNIGFAPKEMNLDYGPDTLFSAGWWNVTKTALKAAAEDHVDIGIFNSPGWSQSGGPWINDSEAMRYLTAEELHVCGPAGIQKQWPGRPSFRDVAVLAFPTPQTDNDSITRHDIQLPGERDSIDISTPQPYTARSLLLYPEPSAMSAHVELSVADTVIRAFDFDRSNPALNVGFQPWGPVVISFPATTSNHFRLIFSDIRGHHGLAAVTLTAAARTERYIEKSLGKMFPTPLPLWNEYQWPAQAPVTDTAATIDPRTVLDLTRQRHPDGTFTWKAPPGNWTIVRFGMAPTGVTNSPAAPEGTGLDVDKLSSRAVAYHFNHFIGRILQNIPAGDRKALKFVVADSYETGSQNFTDEFITSFRKTYHYDPLPWLPVLTGHVVQTPDKSDRFLWDLRRLVADKVAYDYVGTLRRLSHRSGLKLWLENYGHWGFPSEFLLYGGQSDEVSGEFWAEGDLGSIECRDAASAAHIYGRSVVSAESFTSAGNAYGRYPATLKKRADWSFTEGINNTLFHVYIQQPDDTKRPGINAWFGTEFNRNNTWFPHAKAFVDYIRRCNFMLRQGLPVNDVAYFIGEDAPKMTGIRMPALPAGYQFDYINADVIEHRISVHNGRLTLPDGMSYRLLVLPPLTSMRPELLKKLRQLAKEGATIIGPQPDHSPSLQHGDTADIIVRSLAATLWPKAIKSDLTVGQAMGVRPDFEKNTTAPILYAHRSAHGAEIYFVTNQNDTGVRFTPSFRIRTGTPLWCDPVTGTVRPLPVFHRYADHTDVPLKLEPDQSGFVVFTRDRSPATAKENFPDPQLLLTIATPWTVSFDTAMRGPAGPVVFDTLADWSQNPLDSIRNYSGTAVYRTTFELQRLPAGKKVYIDLGKVKVLASVRLNGRELGTAWTSPWRIDVTPAIRAGSNTLEVTVTNTWINRLIGDSRLPKSQRRTWTNVDDFKPDSAYDPSGLMGPVTLQMLDY